MRRVEFYITDITTFWGSGQGEVNIAFTSTCGAEVNLLIPAHVMTMNLDSIIEHTILAQGVADKQNKQGLSKAAKTLKDYADWDEMPE